MSTRITNFRINARISLEEGSGGQAAPAERGACQAACAIFFSCQDNNIE